MPQAICKWTNTAEQMFQKNAPDKQKVPVDISDVNVDDWMKEQHNISLQWTTLNVYDLRTKKNNWSYRHGWIIIYIQYTYVWWRQARANENLK